jgi:hypothetical protein
MEILFYQVSNRKALLLHLISCLQINLWAFPLRLLQHQQEGEGSALVLPLATILCYQRHLDGMRRAGLSFSLSLYSLSFIGDYELSLVSSLVLAVYSMVEIPQPTLTFIVMANLKFPTCCTHFLVFPQSKDYG